ncbi:MAG TPA: PAS domain S-box protein [Bacteroidales bacterium]|nr:PAS domain S-box protein [Bacteroidales bacterium]HRX95527.1 PAS domain S-box protein [Bacteroidales bacterium]
MKKNKSQIPPLGNEPNLNEISSFIRKLGENYFQIPLDELSENASVDQILDSLSTLAKNFKNNGKNVTSVAEKEQTKVRSTFKISDEHKISQNFLRLVNESKNLENLIKQTTDYFHQLSGCSSVGIRLQNGDYFPFWQTRGFSQQFLMDENRLCSVKVSNTDKEIQNNQIGDHCLCSSVINQLTDNSKTYFTKKGSFWVNNFHDFLDTSDGKNSINRNKSICSAHGFKSIALIAISAGHHNLGTIHLADKAPGRFNKNLVEFWERLADKFGIAITKFKAQEALQESEERYRTTLDNMMEGCQIITPDFRYQYVNKAVAEHAKLPVSNLLGKKMVECFPGIDKTEVYKKITECMKDGKARRFDNKFIFPDGKTGWFELSMKRVPEGVFMLSIDITSRKLAEEALSLSEDKFRYVFDNSPIGKSLTRPDGTLEVNNTFCEMLGYSASEMKKLTWQDITHPDDLEESEKQVNLVKNGQARTLKLTKRYLHKNGSIVWTSVSSALRKDEMGNPLYFMTSVNDITEQTLTKARIENYYRQLEVLHNIDKALLEAMSAGEIANFVLHDLRELIPAFDRISVTECDPLTQKLTILAVQPPDKSKNVVTTYPLHVLPEYKKLKQGETVLVKKIHDNHSNNIIIQKLLEQGISSYCVFPFMAEKNLIGTLNFVNSSPIILDDELTTLVEIITKQMAIVLRQNQLMKQIRQNNEDLESRVKERTKALKQSENKYRFLYDQAPDSILVIDAETKRFDSFNQRAYKDLGYTKEEFKKLHIHDIECIESEDEIQRRMKRILKSGTDSFETLHKHKSGRKLNVNVKISLIEIDGKKYFQTIWTNITKLKKTEENIRQLNKELRLQQEALKESNAELESFAYSVSHDLRAPLRAIDGYTKILLEDYGPNLDEEAHRFSSIIRKNSVKMGQLIDDLLSFSRMGRKEMSSQKINMASMVRSVFRELSTTMDKKRIRFNISRLPNVSGDKNMIRQVWVNLISNALKFSSHRELADIHVSCKEDDDIFTFSIKDNGAGFNMKFMDNLFGVFQRLHSQKEFEGTGVGLALVRRIIHRHKGMVYAKAEVDKGATFYFTLPK